MRKKGARLPFFMVFLLWIKNKYKISWLLQIFFVHLQTNIYFIYLTCTILIF